MLQMKFLIMVSVVLSLSLASHLLGEDSGNYILSLGECDDNKNLQLELIVSGVTSFNPTTDTLDLTNSSERIVYITFQNATPKDEFILNILPVDYVGDIEYYGTVSMYVGEDGTSSFPYQIEKCIGQRIFSIDFILEDNSCEISQIDTVRLTMIDKVADNNMIEIFTQESSLVLEGATPKKLRFELTDMDNDEIDVWLLLDDSTSAETHGFTLEVEEKTPGKVSGYINWDAECRLNSFQDTEILKLGLFAKNLDTCDEGSPVVRWIAIQINWPVNRPPTLNVSKAIHEVSVGSQLSLSVTVEDSDGDDTFINIEGPGFGSSALQAQIEVVDVGNTKEVRVKWEPSCEAYLEGDSYHYIIWVQDDHCRKPRADSLNIYIRLVEDRSSFDAFEPANVFTPNGDGINELFQLSGHTDIRRNLPVNTCADRFEHISIHNASGLPVFESRDRNFSWDASGFDSGTYFYSIEYTKTRYKGFLTVLK